MARFEWQTLEFTPSKFRLFTFVILLGLLAAYVYDIYFNSYKISESIKQTFLLTNKLAHHPKAIFQQTKYNWSRNCSIVKPNEEDFSVVIDGVRYPHSVPLHKNRSLDYDCMRWKNRKQKLILFWTKWFGNPTFNYGLGKSSPFQSNGCPIDNCEITNDKSRLYESDLVVVHMRDPIEIIPDQIGDHQRWIFFLYESPVHSSDFTAYNNKFSLSATYRLDSDFFGIYQDTDFDWSINQAYDPNEDFSSGKSEFAVAVISNCGASSQRLEYIRHVQSVVSVHVLGKCGKPCPDKFDNGTIADCKKIISQKYKFYFAFENSICKNYITEKLFGILRYNIIPVVYGYGPYQVHIPKSGYINAFDFKTPIELANYLIYLDSNKTAYNEYFKWKRYVKYTETRIMSLAPICEMCIKLNIDEAYGFEKTLISDMSKFWSTRSDCKRVTSDGTTFSLSD